MSTPNNCIINCTQHNLSVSASVQVVGFQNIRSGNQKLSGLCLLLSFQIEVSLSFCIFTGLSGHTILACCLYEIRPFLLINISRSYKFLILFNKLGLVTWLGQKIFLSFLASRLISVSTIHSTHIQWLSEAAFPVVK